MTPSARRFPARMDAFPAVAAFAEAACRAANASSADVLRLRLVLEELFTNTVQHGHGGDSDSPVDVALDVQPGRIALTYEDTAPAFDPREPGTPERPQEGRVGELGLRLVRGMTCDLTYERAGGRNRVRLRLRASDDRTPPGM